MANKTNNYKFPKPEADDFYDISEYNKAMDILDDTLTEMDQKKLDKNGDASEAVTEFQQEILRENIESGETLSSTLGKVKKWFAEMKDVAFSGHAKDVTTDAAHRFVSDTEKSSWNGKVEATGGDISDTVIETIELIETKFPVPATGETAKVFLGKVKKYIEETKPLNKNMIVHVASNGNDTTGDGTFSKPYKSIQRVLDTIPKDLGSYTAKILISDGLYSERITLTGFHSGILIIEGASINAIVDSNMPSSHLFDNLQAKIIIKKITLKGSASTDYQPVTQFENCGFVQVNDCIIDGSNAIARIGSSINGSNVRFYNDVFNNCETCILNPLHNSADSAPSSISVRNCTGANNLRVFACRKGTLHLEDNLRPQALNPDLIEFGGVIVKSTGAIIGTLQANTNLYVATTGSDTTGDGTSTKPFKTIQYAIGTLPKDLGGFAVSIAVYDGTYGEIVYVQGFHNGVLSIARYGTWTVLNTSCNMEGFVISQCTARITLAGLNLTRTEKPTLIASECANITVWYCQSLLTAESGFYFEACVGRVDSCKTTNKKWGMIASYMSHITSTAWAGGSFGTDNGIAATNGSVVHLVGNQPTGAWQYGTNSGGQFILENGTQISGIMAPGLACTWGTLQGGYVRHGNLNGTAMITMQALVMVTTNLTAGTVYTISGIPPAVFNGVPLAVHRSDAVSSCWVDSGIKIMFKVPISSGDSFYFGGTYLTS